MAAAAPPRREVTLVVTAAGAVQVLRQRSIRLARRDVVERERGLPADARRCRVVLAYGHSRLRSLQELRELFALPQLHVRLLPVRTPAHVLALALHLAVGKGGADALHPGSEQLLDRPLDVDLVGVLRHLEDQRPAILADDGRLLGDDRAPDDVGDFQAHPRASCSFSSAACVSTTRRVFITSRALTRLLGSTRTPSMFRTDNASLSSGLTSTSSALPSMPSRRSISAAAFVLISATLSALTTTTWPSCSFCASAARNAPFSTFLGIRKS